MSIFVVLFRSRR